MFFFHRALNCVWPCVDKQGCVCVCVCVCEICGLGAYVCFPGDKCKDKGLTEELEEGALIKKDGIQQMPWARPLWASTSLTVKTYCKKSNEICIDSTLYFCIQTWVSPLEYLCVHTQSFSRVWLSATPWTIPHQAPLSMGFSRQEYWSGLPFPSPEDRPSPAIEPGSPTSPALADEFFTTKPPGKPLEWLSKM